MSDQGERGDELADLLSRLERFVQNISHEVRNPLQVILLQAERLQRLLPECESRERKAADAIAATVRHLDVLLKALVREARGEAPPTKDHEESVGS